MLSDAISIFKHHFNFVDFMFFSICYKDFLYSVFMDVWTISLFSSVCLVGPTQVLASTLPEL